MQSNFTLQRHPSQAKDSESREVRCLRPTLLLSLVVQPLPQTSPNLGTPDLCTNQLFLTDGIWVQDILRTNDLDDKQSQS